MTKRPTAKPHECTFSIEEIPGAEFPDLSSAQAEARAALAADLAATIRELLEAGILVVENGQIIPNPNR